MTTATFTVAGTNASAAQFRAWGSAISAALDTVGFPKTADTGQVDWATVTPPGTTSTKAGYEIRRFNDTLQATAPIVFRIDYGSAGSTNTPNLWFTIGKGSDGAGNITNVLLTATPYVPSAAFTALPSYISSGDGSLLAFSLWTTAAPVITGLIERSRDADGNPTGAGLTYAHKVSTGTIVHRTWSYPTGLLPASCSQATWPAAVPAAASTGLAVGGLAPVFPAIESDGAGTYWQPRALVSYAPTDGGTGAPISVPGWGTYLPIGHLGWGIDAAVAAIAWS